MKYLTDQFQLCFCFCIGSTISILTDNLLHMLFLVFAFRYLMQL